MNKAFAAAVAAYEERRWEDAIQLATQVLQDEADNLDALELFGLAWFRHGYIDNAIEALEFCQQRAPQNLSYTRNLSELYRVAGKLPQSMTMLAAAAKLDPVSLSVLESSGLALMDSGEFAAAEVALARVADLDPDRALAYFNLGEVRRLSANYDGAIASYEQALTLNPNLLQAQHQIALCLLAQGQYSRAWDLYEHRLDARLSKQVSVTEPRWLGEFEPGQRIFIYSDQGIGDAILFSRYLPHLAAQGVEMLVAIPDALLSLFRGAMPNIEFISLNAKRPICDWQIALGSLPNLYHTQVDTVPNVVPYLAASPEKIAAWQMRAAKNGNAIRIGVCWAGNPAAAGVRHRNCDVSQIAMLFADLPNIQVFSLQFDRADECQILHDKIGAVNLTHDLQDFSDTAALLANLDLVISVDTATLNLAGAMNIPAWGLLPLATEWRWLGAEQRSRWYPSVVRYAQTRSNDWVTPLSVMRDTLYSHIKAGTIPGQIGRQ